MKIRKIEFENNPILGNLKLDFTNNQGETVDTIILAGENGAGKSYLLNEIYYFSIPRLFSDSEKSDEKRYFEIEFSQTEIEDLLATKKFGGELSQGLKDNIFKFYIDYSIVGTWRNIQITFTKKDNEVAEFTGAHFNSGVAKKCLTTIFSDVEINFTPRDIGGVTAKNIDEDNVASKRSNADIASEIAQLLVDIQSIDALELNDWVRKNPGKPADKNIIDPRIKRFSTAFQLMFPTKKYDRIETKNGRKTIIFKEHKNEMEIKHLSSGEKQVVFRGGFLLKDKESTKGALILIDEPEISLHPRWQLKILNFFKQLFISEGKQTSQLIISTHSPFVIHNSNRNNDKVIVLQKNADGKVSVQDDPTFYNWSNEEKVEAAFNVTSLIEADKSVVFLEGETDELYFNKTAEVFGIDNTKISFKWIGRMNEGGQAENTGDKALNQARTYFLANPDMIIGKIVLLYDSDTGKPEETYDSLAIRKMETVQNNDLYEIGIESLLTLYPEFNKDSYYQERIKKDKYGAESTNRSLDKMALCNHICNDLDPETQKQVLEGIKQEIDKLQNSI
tara:strand:+ start:278 stop:1963 length:1686 start_codon:yes stop_codon:yes gene_type:complete